MGWRPFALLVCLLVADHAAAQHPPAPRHPWHGIWSMLNGCPPLGCCPDDYCRKPMPAAPPRDCGGADDYCRKPMPCISSIPRSCICDDYCRKPLPTMLCPPLTPYLQCGPQCAPSMHK